MVLQNKFSVVAKNNKMQKKMMMKQIFTTALLLIVFVVSFTIANEDPFKSTSLKGKLSGVNRQDIERGIRVVMNYNQTEYVNVDGSFEMYCVKYSNFSFFLPNNNI
jgi:hypothetical protein